MYWESTRTHKALFREILIQAKTVLLHSLSRSYKVKMSIMHCTSVVNIKITSHYYVVHTDHCMRTSRSHSGLRLQRIGLAIRPEATRSVSRKAVPAMRPFLDLISITCPRNIQHSCGGGCFTDRISVRCSPSCLTTRSHLAMKPSPSWTTSTCNAASCQQK